MKIGKTPGSVGGTGTPASAGSGASPRTSASSERLASSVGTTGSATVTLSPQLSQLQGALALAGSGEVFDAKQVASIKQAITNGQFQVNPEKVADGLLKSVHEMLASRQQRQNA